MQAQVEELGDSKVRLTVEVPGADVKHAVEHAATDLAGTVKIPGFRQGKVPLTILKQRIGKERLYAEAVESHIGGWFWNAAAQTRIHPVEQPGSERETSTVVAEVKEIHEKVLPPADDDFARKVSEFDSLEELRSDLESDLREQLAAELEGQFRSAAVDTLVRAAGVNAQGPLVEVRTRELLNGLAGSVERRGLSLEQYLSLSGRTAQQLVDSLNAEAALSVAREVVLEAVADRARITVSDDDVEEVIREQVEELDDDFDQTVARLLKTGG